MDPMAVLEGAKDVFTAKRVIGEPYEKDGVTVVPVVAAGGGGGGGGGKGADGQGTGGGAGLMVRPLGAYVIKGDEVSWVPAVDVTRVILMGQLAAVAMLFALRGIIRSRTKRAKYMTIRAKVLASAKRKAQRRQAG